MSEKLDLTKAYNELNETIEKGDHNQILSLCNKILSQYPTEAEIIKSKIIALVNLGKSEEAIKFIESTKTETKYFLEYAYALYDNKNFKESIDVINKNQKTETTNILLAQNYYKLNDYEKSYEIYKNIIKEKIKNEEIEKENDLFTNFLACFAMYKENDDESFVNGLKKYLNSWESYYNFCIIYLKRKNIENTFQLIKRIKEEYPKLEDEFNELKDLVLNLFNIQVCFDGFDLNKYSLLSQKFDTFFRNIERDPKNKDYIKMMPYFFVNFLNFKKDKDTTNEIIRKLDNFLSNKELNLSKEEEKIINKNKINFLIRANKLKEAENLLEKIKGDEDYNIYSGLITYKNEKDKDKAIQTLKSKFADTKKPQDELLIIQLMLTNLTSKNINEFHKTLMEFIKKNKQYCFNEHFINFFIGLYNAKKNPDCLKEFINEFDNIDELTKVVKDKNTIKNIIILFADSFYKSNEFEKSAKYYQYYLDNVNKNDSEIKYCLIQAMVHFDINKADAIRRQIDETETDLSNENINNLLNELFSKFKKNEGKEKDKKKKKKRKIRYPKNFDPKHPGPMPDPERWLPKMQKKKYRAKNKLAHQGAVEEVKSAKK